ncbi:MAG TPA: sulfatase-like hydrolase/transferase [Acidobacteriaceae bacterium]
MNQISRRGFLAGTVATLFNGAIPQNNPITSVVAREAMKPSRSTGPQNLVLFMPDELRADAIACYGNPFTKTPNFDKAARQGTRIEQCRASYPICGASRCSLLTGTRRDFLRNAALASGAVAVVGASTAEAASAIDTAPASSARPNVLMICSDQFRADFIGANHENPSVKTPHLDTLAARGVNFRQCITNQPLCSPSRASFMTGMYATDVGLWKLGLELDHSLPTIATEFRKNGYTTNFVGKWHVFKTNLETARNIWDGFHRDHRAVASTICGRERT